MANYNVNTDKDMEMVFGNPNSPKGGPKTSVSVVNETECRDKIASDTNSASCVNKQSASPRQSLNGEGSTPSGPEIEYIDNSNDQPKDLSTESDVMLPNDKRHDHSGGSREPPSRDVARVVDNGTKDRWWPFDPVDSDGEVRFVDKFGEDDDDPKPQSTPAQPTTALLTPVDVTAYQQRKNLAHGMMDLALLTANANQLRYVIDTSSHPYYYPSVVFISLSIIVQVVVAVLLILDNRHDAAIRDQMVHAMKYNNVTVLGVFLVTFINVMVSAFSVTPMPVASGNTN